MKINDDMLTEWFPPSIKPVHEGLYPTRVYRYGVVMDCIWKNGEWHFARHPERRCIFQDRYWIGLKKEAFHG